MNAWLGFRERLVRNRDLVLVTLTALAVRLFWNLRIHPPLDYAYSDMGGYLERANTSLAQPDQRFAYFTFFPWGTHALIALVKRIFGRDNGAAIGVVYAVLGAVAVAFTFAIAQRLTRQKWIARVVGAILIVYYPWISLGGYVLSEPPFTACLAAVVFFALRLADQGRPRDAWLLGVSFAIGAIFRPQVLVSLVLLAIVLAARRHIFHRFNVRLLVGIAAPIVIALGISAYRMHWHAGTIGLVSQNGPLNYAFGRCHATSIGSKAPDRKSGYAPTSLGALAKYGDEHPDALLKLDPAMGRSLSFNGYIWDAAPAYKLASDCAKKTGLWRQMKYAFSHVVLLWGYNVVWPDLGQKPMFKRPMEIAGTLQTRVVLPAAIVGMALAFRRGRGRSLLIAVHVLALVAVAMIYFGDARLRTPYDGLLVLLAVQAIAAGVGVVWRRIGRARGKGQREGAEAAVE